MRDGKTYDNNLNIGDIAAIIRSIVGLFLLILYYSSLAVDKPVLWAAIDTMITFVAYPLMAILVRHAALKRPVPRKIAWMVSIAWCTVIWIVCVVYNSLMQTGEMVSYPFLHVLINAAILYGSEHQAACGAAAKDDAPDDTEDSRKRTEDRIVYLAKRYNELKSDVSAVKPDDIHAYYTAGKITLDEYNEIENAYKQAVDEMQEIYHEYKRLRGSMEDK